MKEEYLHYLWKMKRLPFHQMKLSNGKDFQLLQHGTFNRFESGPDFQDAKILIDELIWVGPIELHVKSSDWRVHGHQNDNAYNNVILHVVYEHDEEITQDNRLIPVLELKPFIDLNHFQKFQAFTKNQQVFPCGSLLKGLDRIFIYEMIDRSIVQRLKRKADELNTLGSNIPQEVLYMQIARSFGNKLNAKPFEELSRRLPLHRFQKLSKRDKISTVKHVSGLYSLTTIQECIVEQRKSSIITLLDAGCVNSFSWKFKGARPGGFPNKRVEQFAFFVSEFDFDYFFIFLTPKELLAYCRKLFSTVNSTIDEKSLRISKQLADLIIINCFVPFLFWLGQKLLRSELCENALEILQLLPSESNYIQNEWKKVGVNAKNAMESQGLLEIYNNHCLKKKCLTCSIGINVLKL